MFSQQPRTFSVRSVILIQFKYSLLGYNLVDSCSRLKLHGPVRQEAHECSNGSVICKKLQGFQWCIL
jgi:hypothetical protein